MFCKGPALIVVDVFFKFLLGNTNCRGEQDHGASSNLATLGRLESCIHLPFRWSSQVQRPHLLAA